MPEASSAMQSAIRMKIPMKTRTQLYFGDFSPYRDGGQSSSKIERGMVDLLSDSVFEYNMST
jgi:hypothetical protein